jgi:hypothetical protein
MDAPKRPEVLWALLDEFLAESPERDALRWMALGTGLNMERRALITRLLDNVETVCRYPETALPYWLELRAVYRKIDQALAVPNEDGLRTLAAKAIFHAEQMEMEMTDVAWKDTG